MMRPFLLIEWKIVWLYVVITLYSWIENLYSFGIPLSVKKEKTAVSCYLFNFIALSEEPMAVLSGEPEKQRTVLNHAILITSFLPSNYRVICLMLFDCFLCLLFTIIA